MPATNTVNYECDACAKHVVNDTMPVGWVMVNFNPAEHVPVTGPLFGCSIECGSALVAEALTPVEPDSTAPGDEPSPAA